MNTPSDSALAQALDAAKYRLQLIEAGEYSVGDLKQALRDLHDAVTCEIDASRGGADEGHRADEDDYVIDRTGHLLAEIAVIVNGPEPPLTRWSYHDLPEKVRALASNPQPAAAGELPEAVERSLLDEAADELAEHQGFNIELMPEPRRQALEDEVRVVLRVAARERHASAAVAECRRDAERKVCTWYQEDEECDCFDTSCGHVYMVNDAETGGMKFCTFCGGDMNVVMWTPDDDDDAALANLGSGDGKEGQA